MALTEQDRQDAEKNELQRHLEFNLEIIVASAKYERIMTNKDFLEILGDMKRVKEVLDNEILTLSQQMATEEVPRMRETIQNELLTKSIRRMLMIEGSSYPERIVFEAATAKEENVEIRKQLKEKYNVQS